MTAPTAVHPTAIVGPDVEIGAGSTVGPFCILQGRVRLGANVHLMSHINVLGPVEIGDNTRVFPNTCLGFRAQDVKWKDDQVTAGVRIGNDCLIREGVTIHAATKPDIPTTTGDRCFLMVNSHMGHDARIGNDVVLVNAVLLAGHTLVADKVTMGGGAVMHQFCRIGRLGFIGGGTAVIADVPPFCICAQRGVVHGLNIVGLRRNGVPRDQITLLRSAFRKAFRVAMPRKEMVAVLEELGRESAYVMEMAEFVRGAKRSIATGVTGGGGEDGDGE